MIVSIFLRHFKIYKGINYIPISESVGFSSIIGKSSILEATANIREKIKKMF